MAIRNYFEVESSLKLHLLTFVVKRLYSSYKSRLYEFVFPMNREYVVGSKQISQMSKFISLLAAFLVALKNMLINFPVQPIVWNP